MIPPNIRTAPSCAGCRFLASSLMRPNCLQYGAIVHWEQICDDFEWPQDKQFEETDQ
jgi:hypothetical protein